MKIKNDFLRLLASIVLCFSAAGLGGLSTSTAVTSWYLTINKPTWTPPSWLFGPVWTILYLMMAIAFYLIWTKGVTKKTLPALRFFLIQLALNLFWSLIFFGLGNFWLAYLEIITLLLFIVMTIKSFWGLSPFAGRLLIPYLLWVSFASFLNLAIALLN